MITTDGDTIFDNLIPNQKYLVWLEGDFDTATVAVTCSQEGTDYGSPNQDGTALEFTATGGVELTSPGKYLKFSTSSAGVSTSIKPSALAL